MLTENERRHLPFGISDIKNPKDRNGYCPIIGCDTKVKEYPSRTQKNDSELNFCQKHGIFCRKSTYIYREKTENLIIDKDTFETTFNKKQENKKYDTERIGYENSEDALTWNVFISLKQTKQLKKIFSKITGKNCLDEPELVLWGYNLSRRGLFETQLGDFQDDHEIKFNLSILTEPDIILKGNDEIVLIEAKFSSPNSRKTISVWKDSEFDRKTNKCYPSYKKRYGGLFEDVLNGDYIDKMEGKFCSQLVRYILFANYAYKNKTFYLVNLIPHNSKLNKEIESIEKEFSPYLRNPEIFKIITWEEIYYLLGDTLKEFWEIRCLKQYLKEKTSRLKQAFLIH